MTAAPPQPPADLPAGAWAGSYQVGGALRHAPLGTVYTARAQGNGPEIALEILHDPTPDPVRLARCQREAQAAGQVGHPAILAPMEQGLLPDGRAYAVMEKLTGESLQARLERRGGLPLAEAAPWIDAVMEAVNAAHRAGLVHRDLTPTNLFLQEGLHGAVRIRVLDFGLSHFLSRDAQLGPQITRAGQVLGSARYLAPEQASESYGGVGPWTDVYSLGAVAFHMLTGQPPYVAGTAGEILLAHLQAPIPSLRDHRPGLSKGLDAVLHQALAKRPEERFATMDAFRRAFRGSLRGSVVLPVVPELDGPGAGLAPHPTPPRLPQPAGASGPGGLGSSRALPPSETLGTDRTLPPSAGLGTDDTVPPFQGSPGAPRPPEAHAATDPTLDPSQRAAWAATLRPEAFAKAPAPPVTPPTPAPMSPWHKDRDSLEQQPIELDARVQADLGPKPSKLLEPELQRRDAMPPTSSPTPARGLPPPPAPGLPPLPAPGSSHLGLWLLVAILVLGGLGTLVWYLLRR